MELTIFQVCKQQLLTKYLIRNNFIKQYKLKINRKKEISAWFGKWRIRGWDEALKKIIVNFLWRFPFPFLNLNVPGIWSDFPSKRIFLSLFLQRWNFFIIFLLVVLCLIMFLCLFYAINEVKCSKTWNGNACKKMFLWVPSIKFIVAITAFLFDFLIALPNGLAWFYWGMVRRGRNFLAIHFPISPLMYLPVFSSELFIFEAKFLKLNFHALIPFCFSLAED